MNRNNLPLYLDSKKEQLLSELRDFGFRDTVRHLIAEVTCALHILQDYVVETNMMNVLPVLQMRVLNSYRLQQAFDTMERDYHDIMEKLGLKEGDEDPSFRILRDAQQDIIKVVQKMPEPAQIFFGIKLIEKTDFDFTPENAVPRDLLVDYAQQIFDFRLPGYAPGDEEPQEDGDAPSFELN